ncbi:MAG: hypothetical protein PHE24_03090, partial [Patescibacteria group bacterium]|nr:hypothetical protein [Patescibacteria group bacterium]
RISLLAKKLTDQARKKYSKIVGVHIRQGDFRAYANGEYYFSPEKVALILKDFIDKTGLADTCFVIASDEKIKPEIFSGLNIVLSSGKIMEDFFTLAQTDLLIGANSSFGAFAAYYGNIPMAIFSAEPLDWNFYLDQKKFFFDQKSIAHLPQLLN